MHTLRAVLCLQLAKFKYVDGKLLFLTDILKVFSVLKQEAEHEDALVAFFSAFAFFLHELLPTFKIESLEDLDKVVPRPLFPDAVPEDPSKIPYFSFCAELFTVKFKPIIKKASL